MRTHTVIGAAAAAVLASGLVAIASVPTGSASVAGIAPTGSRVAHTATVGRARVLLVSLDGQLEIVVGWRGQKGWLGLTAGELPTDTNVAWTTTAGRPPVPALSAVYGAEPPGGAASATVTWGDGRRDVVPVGADGTWLVTRPGRVSSATVVVRGSNGKVLRKVSGP